MTTVTRRTFGLGIAAAGMASAVPGLSHAQAFPARDIRFVCAFGAGSGADVLVRYFATKVQPLTGRNVVVENKPGASGQIALEFAARSEPDGHTIFVHAGSSVASSMHLFRQPSVDVSSEIQVVATINEQPYMVVVGANSPHQTLAELSAAMQEKGDQGNYGTANPVTQIMGELYKESIGADTAQILYASAADTVGDLSSGVLDFATVDPAFALAQQRQGSIRILATSSPERMEATADIPTMTEQGAPMEVVAWWAAMVPTATPQPIQAQIREWFEEVVASDETREFLASFGGQPYIVSSEEGQDRLVSEIDLWGEWVEIANIEPH